jgi:hypothetical protein
MSLLAPLLLTGLLGLSLPILAHLLGRERPLEVRFAALRFLPTAEPSVTHRRTLQDLPLLLVRILLLALIVFALARPVTEDRGGVSVVAEVHDAVVLVDASASMDLRVDGSTLREHAGERAEALLRSIPSGSRVGLLTSDPDGPQVEPTTDTSAVLATLQQWVEDGDARPGSWTMSDALPGAATMLGDLDGQDRKRVVYALGDATERGLAGLPPQAEGNVVVVPISAIDPDEPIPEQIGIRSVLSEPAPDLDPLAVRVQAVLRRFAGTEEGPPMRKVGVALRIGETEVARTEVELPPDQDTAVEFTHTLLDVAEAAATVELIDLPDDPYPLDDRRYLWLAADEGMEIAVVNGDPSELRAHDEVFFMTTAVAATKDQHDVQVRSLALDQLEEAVRGAGESALAETDVLVLANVRAPAPDVAATIAERVRRGMGLWITVGNRVAEEEYNQRFGDLLPLRLREAVQVGTAPGRTEARVEGISPADLSHPVFRGLSGDLGLAGTRVRRIVLLEPDPKRNARIALSFTSGAPALLTTEVGEGRVALLTTTIDRDWADLPLRPGYVPMVGGVLSYLGAAGGGLATDHVLVGDTRSVRVEGPVTVKTPDGREVSIAPEDGVATFDDTFVPGHYLVRLGEGRSSAFVVDVDPAESVVKPAELHETELQGEQQQVAVYVPQWRWLILLAAALLGLEAALRWRIARRRAAQAPSDS